MLLKKEKMIIASTIISILIIMISSIYFADILPKREVLEPTEIYSSKNIDNSALLKDDANGGIYISYGKPNTNQWVLRKINGKNLSSEIAINLTKYNLTTGVLPSCAVYNKTLYLLAKGGILIYNLENNTAKTVKINKDYVAGDLPYSAIKCSSKYIAFSIYNNSNNALSEKGNISPILIYDIHTSTTRWIHTNFVLKYIALSPNGRYLSYASTDGASKFKDYLYVTVINMENNHSTIINVSKEVSISAVIDPIVGNLQIDNNGKIRFVFSTYSEKKVYYYVEIYNSEVTYESHRSNILNGLSGEIEIVDDKIDMLFMKENSKNKDIWQVSLEVLNRELNITKKYSFECRGFEAMDGGFSNFEISKAQNEIYVELKGDKWAIFAIPI